MRIHASRGGTAPVPSTGPDDVPEQVDPAEVEVVEPGEVDGEPTEATAEAGRGGVASGGTGRAVLCGLALVALVLVAYSVGQSRSGQPGGPGGGGQAASGAGGAVTPDMLGRVQPVPVAPDNPPNAHQPVPNVPVTVHDGQGGDPREKGVNYFILAHYPEKEARKLVQFLSSQGVETVAVRRKNSSRLYQVLALRPFPSGTLGSPQRSTYQRQLQRLGQTWKQRHKGPTDLADMYPARYNGEPVAAVITKEPSHEPRSQPQSR